MASIGKADLRSLVWREDSSEDSGGIGRNVAPVLLARRLRGGSPCGGLKGNAAYARRTRGRLSPAAARFAVVPSRFSHPSLSRRLHFQRSPAGRSRRGA